MKLIFLLNLIFLSIDLIKSECFSANNLSTFRDCSKEEDKLECAKANYNTIIYMAIAGDPGFNKTTTVIDPLLVDKIILNTKPHKLQIHDVVFMQYTSNATMTEFQIDVNNSAKTFKIFGSWSSALIEGSGSIIKYDHKSYTKLKGKILINAYDLTLNDTFFGFIGDDGLVKVKSVEAAALFKSFDIKVKFESKSYEEKKLAKKFEKEILESFKLENAFEFLTVAGDAWTALLPESFKVTLQCTTEDEFNKLFPKPELEYKYKHHKNRKY